MAAPARLAERILGLVARRVGGAGHLRGLPDAGARLRDPQGVETPAGADVPGLGLLPVETVFLPRKATRQVQGSVAVEEGPLAGARGAAVTAYEIHMGETTPLPDAPSRPSSSWRTAARTGRWRPAGASPRPTCTGRSSAGPTPRPSSPGAPPATGRTSIQRAPPGDAEAEYDRLAAVLRQALDVPTSTGSRG